MSSTTDSPLVRLARAIRMGIYKVLGTTYPTIRLEEVNAVVTEGGETLEIRVTRPDGQVAMKRFSATDIVSRACEFGEGEAVAMIARDFPKPGDWFELPPESK